MTIPAHTAWSGKIGVMGCVPLPKGADWPMRQAVEEAFLRLTGVHCEFGFTGWGAQLDEIDYAVILDRTSQPIPQRQIAQVEHLYRREGSHAYCVRCGARAGTLGGEVSCAARAARFIKKPTVEGQAVGEERNALSPEERIRAVTAKMRRWMPNACGDWADEIDAALADSDQPA